MATSTTTNRVDDDEVQHCQLVDCFCDRLVVDHHDERERHGGDVVPGSRDAVISTAKRPPVSRLAVEGASGNGSNNMAGGGVASRPPPGKNEQEDGGRRRSGAAAGRTLPPPHAWLAIEDTNTTTKKQQHNSDPEEQWARLLRGGHGDGVSSSQQHKLQHQQRRRRSSFSVVRRERAAREAWLDRAWEMKRSWHERNGGAPDAGTPVVVVVGKAAHHGHEDGECNSSSSSSSPPPSSHHHHHAAPGAVGGGGVAMDVEEVRACRDLGLELPSDCTVEIQCFGLSSSSGGDTSPTDTNASSPCAGICSPGADPMDVKARLKVWAHAVALTSTTQLGP